MTLTSLHLRNSSLSCVPLSHSLSLYLSVFHSHKHSSSSSSSLSFLLMAAVSHAVHLNVKYRGGGHEPFPSTLPANGSHLNNLPRLVVFSWVDIKATEFEWKALELDDSRSSECNAVCWGRQISSAGMRESFPMERERKYSDTV